MAADAFLAVCDLALESGRRVDVEAGSSRTSHGGRTLARHLGLRQGNVFVTRGRAGVSSISADGGDLCRSANTRDESRASSRHRFPEFTSGGRTFSDHGTGFRTGTGINQTGSRLRPSRRLGETPCCSSAPLGRGHHGQSSSFSCDHAIRCTGVDAPLARCEAVACSTTRRSSPERAIRPTVGVSPWGSWPISRSRGQSSHSYGWIGQALKCHGSRPPLQSRTLVCRLTASTWLACDSILEPSASGRPTFAAARPRGSRLAERHGTRFGRLTARCWPFEVRPDAASRRRA